jgi:Domain of unknown function (DUF4260)
MFPLLGYCSGCHSGRLFVLGRFEGWPTLVAASILWFSRIAFDRMLGYGLKYPAHFKDTHLQHLA